MCSAALEKLVDREQGGLGVQGVEDGLDHDQVDAALDQPGNCLGVGRDQFVKARVAGAGVIDVGRERSGAIGGAENSGDEARPFRRSARELVSRLARQPRTREVQFPRVVLHAVVGHGDARRVESVGLDDIRAGLEIRAMDARR